MSVPLAQTGGSGNGGSVITFLWISGGNATTPAVTYVLKMTMGNATTA